MKIRGRLGVWFPALMVALCVPSPSGFAQSDASSPRILVSDIPTEPPVATYTSPITDYMIARADIIARVIIGKSEKVGNGIAFSVSPAPGWKKPIKGAMPPPSWKVVLVTRYRARFPLKTGEEWIIFADDNENNVAYIGHAARISQLGASATQVIEHIKAVTQRKAKIAVYMTTNKTNYTSGETVIAIWRIRNISLYPVKIYASPDDFGYGYSMRGVGMSQGVGNWQRRTAADYKTLQPNEVFEKTIAIKAPLPEGEMHLYMGYEEENNWEMAANGKAFVPVEGMVYAHKNIERTVSFAPAPTDEKVESVP